MITLRLDVGTLARVRLAPSPVAEAVAWLGLASTGGRHPLQGRPSAAARSTLSRPEVGIAASLLAPGGRGYQPDFLTPKPGPASRRGWIGDQLEQVAATDPESVAAQLDWRFPRGRMPRPVAVARDDGSLARKVAAGLAAFWRDVFGDHWHELRRPIDDDVARRTETVAATGLGALMGSLDPAVSWHAGVLAIDIPPWEEHADLVDAELVITPRLLGLPGPTIQLHDPTQAVLGYAVVAADVARSRAGTTPSADLLGRTRSAVLGSLGHAPTSTTELSRRLQITPATASHHLGILHRAGLVSRTARGHVVLYALTPTGRRLAPPAGEAGVAAG